MKRFPISAREQIYDSLAFIVNVNHLLKGPFTPETIIDFWKMIWQENSSRVVMLTNLYEGDHVRLHIKILIKVIAYST